MRQRTAAVGLMAATSLLAGCADDQAASSEDQVPTRFDKRADAIERDWPDLKPLRGGPDDMLPLENAEPSAENGTTFTVVVGRGSCGQDYDVHVRESEKLVIVSGWAPSGDADTCADQLLTEEVEVKLENKLADRPVVDAVTGKRLLNE